MKDVKLDPTVHGYSGKPLFQKLGLKPGMRCLPLNAPDHYSNLVEGAEDVTFLEAIGQADMVHLFCRDRATLDREKTSSLGNVADSGMFWVSWPKKSSRLFKDLTEDGIREAILPFGWVDVKVCAIDQDWSALKFLRRRS